MSRRCCGFYVNLHSFFSRSCFSVSPARILVLRREGKLSDAMSDSGPKTMPVAAGVSLAAAGLLVGLMGPKIVEKIILKMKPGGKFSGVSVSYC